MGLSKRHARSLLPDVVVKDYDRDPHAAHKRWVFVMADMEDSAQIWLAKPTGPKQALRLAGLLDVVPGRHGAVLPNSHVFRAAHALGFDRCVWRTGHGLRVDSIGLGLGRNTDLHAGPPDPRARFVGNARAYRSAVRLGVAKRKIKELVFDEHEDTSD